MKQSAAFVTPLLLTLAPSDKATPESTGRHMSLYINFVVLHRIRWYHRIITYHISPFDAEHWPPYMLQRGFGSDNVYHCPSIFSRCPYVVIAQIVRRLRTYLFGQWWTPSGAVVALWRYWCWLKWLTDLHRPARYLRLSHSQMQWRSGVYIGGGGQWSGHTCSWGGTDLYCHSEPPLDPEAKARASGSEREMGQARARKNFSRSEREK